MLVDLLEQFHINDVYSHGSLVAELRTHTKNGAFTAQHINLYASTQVMNRNAAFCIFGQINYLKLYVWIEI